MLGLLITFMLFTTLFNLHCASADSSSASYSDRHGSTVLLITFMPFNTVQCTVAHSKQLQHNTVPATTVLPLQTAVWYRACAAMYVEWCAQSPFTWFSVVQCTTVQYIEVQCILGMARWWCTKLSNSSILVFVFFNYRICICILFVFLLYYKTVQRCAFKAWANGDVQSWAMAQLLYL